MLMETCRLALRAVLSSTPHDAVLDETWNDAQLRV
jgi:hypothetical protein